MKHPVYDEEENLTGMAAYCYVLPKVIKGKGGDFVLNDSKAMNIFFIRVVYRVQFQSQ